MYSSIFFKNNYQNLIDFIVHFYRPFCFNIRQKYEEVGNNKKDQMVLDYEVIKFRKQLSPFKQWKY